jgi:uncharacterized protein (DUF302 family)
MSPSYRVVIAGPVVIAGRALGDHEHKSADMAGREPAGQRRPQQPSREVWVSEGLITVESRFPVAETIDRLATAAAAAGLVVFARIDHAKGAREAGLPLRPTELLIFGHPRGGVPLMLDSQPVGIDPPFKALAWQDEGGQVWLTWNDAQWLAQRHGLNPRSASAVQAIRNGASNLAATAAGLKVKALGPDRQTLANHDRRWELSRRQRLAGEPCDVPQPGLGEGMAGRLSGVAPSAR